MLEFEEAQRRILQIPYESQIVQLQLHQCIGKVSARDEICSLPIPHWDNSAMDGFAVRSQDHLQERSIIEEIPAGTWPTKHIEKKECSRIFTGAPLPIGSDSVLIQENAIHVEGKVQPTKQPLPNKNIRKKGEEFNKGDVFLQKGQRINVGHIALAAAQGIRILSTYKPLRIGVLSTGDELIDEERPLQGAEIYASNTNTLLALIAESNHDGIHLGIAKDNKESIREHIWKGQQSCDIVLSSGGVSVGKYDLVQQVLEEMGMKLDFWKVKMKPGKPIVFGQLNQTPFIGLPGNPVSCTVVFLTLLRPWLKKIQGESENHLFLPTIQALLDEDFTKKHGRAEFFRMQLHRENNKYLAKRTGNQSSAWMSSISQGDGLFYVNSTPNQQLTKGMNINISLFPWKQSLVFS
jgi:molybdopterin molybdotransferase